LSILAGEIRLSTATLKSEQLTVAWMRSIGFCLDSRAGALQLEELTVEAIREVSADWKWRLQESGKIPAPKSRSEVLELCAQVQIRVGHDDANDSDVCTTIIFPRIAA
jgi:hypothetical protein